MTLRRTLLATALAVTLALTGWVATREDDETAEIVAAAGRDDRSAVGGRPQRSAGEPADADPVWRARFARLAETREPWPDLADSFARIVVFSPAPPVSTTLRRPPPLAPPLPFAFVGAMRDGDGEAVFLLDGGQVRMARAGDELPDGYRLDAITPSALEFTYLPLGAKQRLVRDTP